MSVIYHIAAATDWRGAQQVGVYTTSTRGRTLAQEGFIHCSDRHQVMTVADAVFADVPDLVLLTIDTDKVAAPVRYEQPMPGSQRYPHIYGPLEVTAVLAVEPFHPDRDVR